MSTQEPKPPETGFTVAERLSQRGWMNVPTDGWGEYIHLFPDPENRRLWLFRAFKESGDRARLVADVPNVSVRLSHRHNPVHKPRGEPIVAPPDDRSEHGRYDHDPADVRCFYLTGSEADTFITFLDLLAREAGDPTVTLTWYGDNGKGLHEGSPVREESLYLHYRTEGGKERRVVIQSAYRTVTQMLANFD